MGAVVDPTDDGQVILHPIRVAGEPSTWSPRPCWPNKAAPHAVVGGVRVEGEGGARMDVCGVDGCGGGRDCLDLDLDTICLMLWLICQTDAFFYFDFAGSEEKKKC